MVRKLLGACLLGGSARAEVGNGTVAIVRSVGTLLTIR